MSTGQRLYYRYSESFKQQVVSEIDSGKYTIGEAVRIYGVSYHSIHKWCRKLGKGHLIGKVVKVQKIGEADRIKELEKEKQALEHALAQAHLKILTLESTLELATDQTGVDFKKKLGGDKSSVASRK